MVPQALVVEQHAGDDERPGERPAPRLVRARDQPHAEPAVEPQQLLAGLAALRTAPAEHSPSDGGRHRAESGSEFAKKLRLAQLADASLLADLAAQVVQLGAVDVADRMTSILSIFGECSGNVRSTPTPNEFLRTVNVSRAPAPWRLITMPSNTWIRWRGPSITRKWTRTCRPP